MNKSINLEYEFFKFIYNRQLIWYKRFVLKQNPPWTDDEILKTFKIINVYRELDRCTLYILNKLKATTDRNKLFINIVFYRFFNQSNLYEKLNLEIFDEITPKISNKIESSLNLLIKEGKPIFNNAYLISSGTKGQKKHISILKSLQNINVKQIIGEIDSSKNPREALEIIQKISMVGPFLACEIWTDLSYFKFFKQNWTDNDFVNIGPGSKWGLEILSGKNKLSKSEQEAKLNHLHKIQESKLNNLKNIKENLSWKDIAYKEAFSNYPYLSITNIEGSLCEFRKYWNIKNGKGRRKYFKAIS